jgi:mannobiose 2-epimerase
MKEELYKELTGNILPFWMNKMTDREHGGYYGQMTGKNEIVSNAPKGGILNARILWTFSSAALSLHNPEYLLHAKRAKEYIFTHFFDTKSGGVYWLLNADGSVADAKKQIYNQAFFIYALVEYYRATQDGECLAKAIDLFKLIEQHSFDAQHNGYFEAYSRDWELLDDLRLSEKDENEKKTMNTHLHILEAYTNLYRVWKDESLARQLRNLITVFTDIIIDSETGHLLLFFDEEWKRKSAVVSYGHDIEASWLLYEAAEVLGDKQLTEKVKRLSLLMADAAGEGLQPDGSMIYEYFPFAGEKDRYDSDRHWWVQAETVVGYAYAYKNSGNVAYKEKSDRAWQYIRDKIVDTENGEWHWSRKADGSINRIDDKAGFWKCPYHNSRMCLELWNNC